MIIKVRETIDKWNMLPDNRSVVLAVSGGVDSTVMTHIMVEFNIKPVICHLNHSFRGEESVRDANFVKNLAHNFKVPFELKIINVPDIIKKTKGGSPQNISRILRLKFFKEVAEKYSTRVVMTAHNLDDHCETFFLRLFRGSGSSGLGSISYISEHDGFKIVRPLLDISRDEIFNHAKEKSISYVEDSSNNQDKYDRNRLRNVVIPEIKKSFNPNLSKTIRKVSKLSQMDEEYFDSVIKSLDYIYDFRENGAHIRLNRFNELHIAVKTRLLRHIIKKVKGDLLSIGFTNVNDILKISKSTEQKKEIVLPQGIYARKINNVLVISRK